MWEASLVIVTWKSALRACCLGRSESGGLSLRCREEEQPGQTSYLIPETDELILPLYIHEFVHFFFLGGINKLITKFPGSPSSLPKNIILTDRTHLNSHQPHPHTAA